jgi:glycosyltransferase involved in cell wall biosynthesis
MKIAFVLNLDSRSAIARETLKLCEYVRLELAHDVVLFSPLGTERLDTTLLIKNFSHPEEIVNILREFDHVIYPIGDSPHHVNSVFLLRRVPGFCIMHDIDISNLMHSYLNGFQDDSLVSAYENFRGYTGVTTGKIDSLSTLIKLSQNEIWQRFPHAKILLLGSYGWLTHSNFAHLAIASGSGEKGVISKLPFTPPPHYEENFQLAQTLPDESILVLGMLNSNKSPELILKSFSLVSEKHSNTVLKFVGYSSSETKTHLKKMASDLGISESVEFIGEVNDIRLEHELSNAGIFLNLRNPVLEAMSYSLLEQAFTGRPVVCFNHGHYMEMPDSIIDKVPVNISEQDLAKSIQDALLRSRANTSKESLANREYIKEHHSLSAYANKLIETLKVLDTSRVVQDGLIDVALNFGENLSSSKELNEVVSNDLSWICQSKNNY